MVKTAIMALLINKRIMFSQFSDFKDILPTVYVCTSLFVALSVIIEATLLEKNGGKMPVGRMFMVVSIFSTAWTLVSGLAWFFLELELFGSVVAFVYPLYSILGLLYSARLMRGVDLPDDPAQIALPIKYLHYCRSFGIVYFALCLVAVFELFGRIQI